MAEVKKKLPWWVKLMRYFGRSLIILWAAFWLLFVWLQVAFGAPPFNPVWIVVLTVLALGSVLIPWFLELTGGIVAISTGVFIFVLQWIAFKEVPLSGDDFLLMYFAPITGGILSLVCGAIARKTPVKEEK